MTLFSDNLRYLREKRKESQSQTAEKLEMKRGRYEPYESGKVEPPYDVLKRIARHFGISIDLLLSVDVRKYKIEELLKLDDNRIVLPIAVDHNGDNLIEIVPHKARAGYLTGYADPEWIGKLPVISLPFLGRGKHRAFPIGGDSMPPHDDQSFIVGKYIENLSELKRGKTYVFIIYGEGMTYKRLNLLNSESIIVESDNVIYSPYEIRFPEIIEIWEFVAYIGRSDLQLVPGDHMAKQMFMELKTDIKLLSDKLIPLGKLFPNSKNF